MRSATHAYLALVREGRNDWWRYVLSVVFILIFYVVLSSAPFELIRDAQSVDRLSVFIALNAGALIGFAGLVVAMAAIHRRRLMSLVTPYAKFDWRRAGEGFAVWFAFAALASAIESALFPGRYRFTFNPETFFLFAAIALCLTPLQAASEELLFRGYVMQGVGLVVKRPIVIAVISSVIFTLPHLSNPEVASHAVLVPASYFVMGLTLAAVTLKDGRLEAAIGLHAANNLFTGLIANYEASALTTDAIFTSTLDPVFAFPALVGAGAATYLLLGLRSRTHAASAQSASAVRDAR